MHASGLDDADNSVDFLAELSARSGWPLEDLHFLLDAGAWQRFTHPAQGAAASIQLDLGRERFPFQFRTQRISVQSAQLYLKLRPDAAIDPEASLLSGATLRLPSDVEGPLTFEPSGQPPLPPLPMATGSRMARRNPGAGRSMYPQLRPISSPTSKSCSS
jgi:hypothetical protein